MVEAFGVAGSPIFLDAVAPFVFGPFGEGGAFPFEVIVGDGVAAGAEDHFDVEGVDLAGTGVVGEEGGEFAPRGVAGAGGGGLAVESEDEGEFAEGAKHDGHAAVF